MTPSRSGSNYPIQSNGSGPGHSGHESKRQECQPRGEAQMENSRNSTSSQRLASTFETLIQSPEADITGIPIKFVGPEKTEDLLRGWTPMSFKGQAQQIKALLKNQNILSEDQKKKLAQGKTNSLVEAPKASKRKDIPQQVPNKDKKAPKRNQEGKQKVKPKWKKPYPQNYKITNKEKTGMENVFNM
ncbi:hypothetical protein O181_038198 [Austropuccinia psidii MF-1]|uniref:Uncharacterized protein n=1 Tax=Austropuccinia psidii MF-1 TaxID=1389203 RepID=A0A9Q3DAZ1_9BASI|nr:hypothetical protein [Austropuccinia psidii MF-1]